GSEIVSCEHNKGRWQLRTADGHEDVVDVVIAATGVLHHPAYPDLDGLDAFAGACFHSARWDHEVPIDGRRVGVVGTGSTAVQIVTAVAERVGDLRLFQRTAQWVMPVANPEYSEAEREQFRANPDQLLQAHENLAIAFGGFAGAVIDSESVGMAMIERMCLENLETVQDAELRERLRPTYRAGCKRLVVSPNFYETMQQPNVDLVTSGITRVEPGGVRTEDGLLHELDVLVLATGFRADAFVRPMGVIGRDGKDLADEWTERPNAYLSVAVPGFPNFFMINGPNGPVGNFSLIEVAEIQFAYILQLVEQLAEGPHRAVSPTVAAMDAHEAARVEAAQPSIWVTGCQSWYLDDRGIPATWPWTFDRFREVMATPDPSAFETV
ncbi:MAG: NAD(P)/FAD-dependent oxidoreductase, partial [Acidimicrobiia bacterium]